MGDDRINVFEPPKLLQELGTDRKGLELGVRLLTVQGQQSALLADRLKLARWLAALVRDGEWISDTQLSEIVLDADEDLSALQECQQRNGAERRRLETELSHLAEKGES